MEPSTDTVIIFYSKDGNTRLGATLLQKRVGGTCVELVEKRRGNFIQAIFKRGSKLAGDPWAALKPAQKVCLMQPIWASNAVPAMNTFLRNADFTGKDVTIITFQQFTDLQNSDKVHDYIAALVTERGGNVVDRHAFVGGKMGHCAPQADIAAQIDTLA